MSDSPMQERLGWFLIRCKDLGIKATHQRMEIYRELVSTHEHPDAEAIFQRIRGRIPTISLDTIYRNLRLFEEKGLINRVGIMGDRTRFDANIYHHHHFVCTSCGLISDFAYNRDSELTSSMVPGLPGEVESIHIELRGRCMKCGNA